MVLLSVLNAVYTFWRRKHYRLFESNIDAVPSTPSANRVRVDSSPVASSPLVYLTRLLGTDNAQSRAHPDPQRDVWQVAIWDPLPVCLRLFCYFSPGHVLVYWLFLPVSNADPRPSTTVATAITVAVLLSAQLSLLQSNFSQQSKDSALISKEVLHEYDTKYVRPNTRPLYRDVGLQFSEQASYTASKDAKYNTVDTYTPMLVVNRGFKTNPNPTYAQHVDPDAVGPPPGASRYSQATPKYTSSAAAIQTPASFQSTSTPMRPTTVIRQPVFRPNGGDGGSLGVYSHAASPLRKSSSANFHARNRNRERLSMSPEKRPASPDKRMSVPPDAISTAAAERRWGHLQSSMRESGRY